MDLDRASTSTLAAATAIWEGLGRPERLRPSPIQERLVAAGRPRRKTGEGFYRYDEAGRRRRGRRRVARRPTSDRRPSGAIRDRILGAIAAEAALARGRGRRHRGRHRPRAAARRRAIPVGPFERDGARSPTWAASVRPLRLSRAATIGAMTRDLHRPLREAWVVEAVRTPIGRYGGALAAVRPDDLAAVAIRGRRRRAGHRPGADRGRDPRLRQPGRRGQPRRRPDGAAARRAAGRGRRPDRQPPVRLGPPGDQLARPTRSRSATATCSSAAASSR